MRSTSYCLMKSRFSADCTQVGKQLLVGTPLDRVCELLGVFSFHMPSLSYLLHSDYLKEPIMFQKHKNQREPA